MPTEVTYELVNWFFDNKLISFVIISPQRAIYAIFGFRNENTEEPGWSISDYQGNWVT